jgi:hypothetical protein
MVVDSLIDGVKSQVLDPSQPVPINNFFTPIIIELPTGYYYIIT